jgi:hypothetical protein
MPIEGSKTRVAKTQAAFFQTKKNVDCSLSRKTSPTTKSWEKGEIQEKGHELFFVP